MDSEHSGVVAVIGAVGAIGREVVTLLEEREFPLSELRLFSGSKMAGERIAFRGDELLVQEFTEEALNGVSLAFVCAAGTGIRNCLEQVIAEGLVLIDCEGSATRGRQRPMIVPEVNADLLRETLQALAPRQGVALANPTSAAIQLAVALGPIHAAFTLKRVVVSTYHSVSAAGRHGVRELEHQVRALFTQQTSAPTVFPQQIAFNCIPHVRSFRDDGYTEEEHLIARQLCSLLGLPHSRATVTAVYVPMFACIGASVSFETEQPCAVPELRKILRESPGVMLVDDPMQNEYPLPREVVGSDATYVGRVREDQSVTHGAHLWVVADNVRKGSALNGVQIAEIACPSTTRRRSR